MVTLFHAYKQRIVGIRDDGRICVPLAGEFVPTRRKVREGFSIEDVVDQFRANGWMVCDFPSEEEIESWVVGDLCETPDGCLVEPDGHCPHGQPSWLMLLGLV